MSVTEVDDVQQVQYICCVSREAAEQALKACRGVVTAAIERILQGSAHGTASSATSPTKQATLQWTKRSKNTEQANTQPVQQRKRFVKTASDVTSARGTAAPAAAAASGAHTAGQSPSKEHTIDSDDEVQLLSSDDSCSGDLATAPAHAPIAAATPSPLKPQPTARHGDSTAATANTVSTAIENFDPWAHGVRHCAPSKTSLRFVDPPHPLTYQLCTDAFAAVDAIKGRLHIMDMLTNMFRAILAHDPSQVLPAVLLAGNKLSTPSGSAELNVGGAAVAAAVREVTGASRAQMSALYKTHGDLGDVAAALKQRQRLLVLPPPLTIPGVHAMLLSIAKQTGKGSGANRGRIMCSMLRACTGSETQYLVRTLLQHLRIGVSMDTILCALARASALHVFQTAPTAASGDLFDKTSAMQALHAYCTGLQSAPQLVAATRSVRAIPDPASLKASLAGIAAECKLAFSVCPDPCVVAAALATPGSVGASTLRQACQARPGHVLKPMLAKIARSTTAAIDSWGTAPFAAEYKYDGQRAQVHLWGSTANGGDAATPKTAGFDSEQNLFTFQTGQSGADQSDADFAHVRVFSRHLENTTQRWLDVCDTFSKLGKSSFHEPSSPAALVLQSANTLPHDTWYPCIAAFDKILGDPVNCVRSCILDAEIIGVQHNEKSPGQFTIRPFQELSRRARVVPLSETHQSAMPASNSISTPVGESAVVEAGGTVVAAGLDQACQVCTVVFDVIQWNGVPLQGCPFWFRRAVLLRHLRCTPGKLQLAEQVVTCDLQQLQKYLEQSVQDACEGLMLKLLGDPSKTLPQAVQSLASSQPRLPSVHAAAETDIASPGSDLKPHTGKAQKRRRAGAGKIDGSAQTASAPANVSGTGASDAANMRGAGYEPSKRSDAWLKLKRDYIDGMGDTLDLVPIGGWWGNGRKAGWFSPILLAAYDAENEQFASVCRCMSGFTDEFYKEITAFYSKPENQWTPPSGSCGPPLGISTSESPPVWFRPTAVWELKGADFTLSPVHMAGYGLVSATRGISLRFPRFLRVRVDKGPEDCTTVEDLADMHLAQARRVQPAE